MFTHIEFACTKFTRTKFTRAKVTRAKFTCIHLRIQNLRARDLREHNFSMKKFTRKKSTRAKFYAYEFTCTKVEESFDGTLHANLMQFNSSLSKFIQLVAFGSFLYHSVPFSFNLIQSDLI